MTMTADDLDILLSSDSPVPCELYRPPDHNKCEEMATWLILITPSCSHPGIKASYLCCDWCRQNCDRNGLRCDYCRKRLPINWAERIK